MPLGDVIKIVRLILDGAAPAKFANGNPNKIEVEVIIAAILISLIWVLRFLHGRFGGFHRSLGELNLASHRCVYRSSRGSGGGMIGCWIRCRNGILDLTEVKSGVEVVFSAWFGE